MSECRVVLAERLAAIAPDFTMDENDEVTYSWSGGYETFNVRYGDNGGGHEYRGVYHPDAVCEGNPCRWCGRAEWGDV